jgi:hypothetical protein
MKALYLSFADDDGFKGVILVRTDDLMAALTTTHILGINPGGEVLSMGIPEQCVEDIPEDKFLKLLSLQELEQLFGEMVHFSELIGDKPCH